MQACKGRACVCVGEGRGDEVWVEVRARSGNFEADEEGGPSCL